MTDLVHSPPHYRTAAGIEAIDVIEAVSGLEFHLPTAVKYILRHQAKGRPAEDLAKAKWYVDRILTKKGLPARQPALAFDHFAVAADAFGLTGAAREALIHILDALATRADDRRWACLRSASACLDTAIRARRAHPTDATAAEGR
jgi:hypothetical protein